MIQGFITIVPPPCDTKVEVCQIIYEDLTYTFKTILKSTRQGKLMRKNEEEA